MRAGHIRPSSEHGGTVSVIFDALNKLNKEKRAPKTGMLIVGAGSIDGRRRGVSGSLVGAASIGVLLLGVAAWWWTRDVAEPVPAKPTVAAGQAGSDRPAAEGRSARTPDGPTVLPGDLAVVPPAIVPAGIANASGEPGSGSDNEEPDPKPAATARGNLDTPPPSEPEQLRLEAITVRDGGPVAIVSGRLVREGDVFDGIEVVRIDEAEVELFLQAENRTLALRF